MRNPAVEQLAARLTERFDATLSRCTTALGQVTIELACEHVLEVCRALRDDPGLEFKQLIDLCGLDYGAYGQAEWQTESASRSGFSRGVSEDTRVEARALRFAVVYQLLSVSRNQRLRLRVYAPGEPPRVDSVVEVWASADWYEREAFDLFGILFDGHPDLRRILTDYGFIGHPFRKDFPLEGNVEVRYDPDQGRVIYQPVTIQNRVLVPRVIRRDYPVPGHAQPDA